VYPTLGVVLASLDAAPCAVRLVCVALHCRFHHSHNSNSTLLQQQQENNLPAKYCAIRFATEGGLAVMLVFYLELQKN
jgi:hypothetical protein